MNCDYASLETWISEIGSIDATVEDFLPHRGSSDLSTRVDDIKAFAAYGIAYLKHKDPYSSVTQSDNRLWWLSQCLKKFRFGCTATVEETERGFIARNSLVNETLPARYYRRVRELLSLALPPTDDNDIDGRFGPGAVFERLNPIQKWNSTSQWSFSVRDMHLLCPHAQPLMSDCARLCCVPKDFYRHRLITVEPVENSFGQQWTRSVLLKSIHNGILKNTIMDGYVGALRSKSITYENRQADLQRDRCLEASRTGSLATLDLSDASDSISFECFASAFPSWVVALCERFRTPRFTSFDGEHDLRIYAGMGNATTFVIETLYFWAAMTAIQEWLHLDRSGVTVFGDDIIADVRAASHPLFDSECRRFGFILNPDKCGLSVSPGFREACGLCAVNGYKLADLIRIPGFCVDTTGGLIDFCGLISSLLNSTVKAHQVLGYDLWDSNPNIRSVRELLETSSTDFIQCDYLPPRGDVPVRWNCAYQRLEYQSQTFAADTQGARLRSLSPCEALGVLHGSLAVRPNGKKTMLFFAKHNAKKVVSRWVN